MTVQTAGETLLDSATEAVREAVASARSEIAPRLEQLAATVEEASSEHGPAGLTAGGATVGSAIRRTAVTVRPNRGPHRWAWAAGLLVAGAAGAWAFSRLRSRRAGSMSEQSAAGWEPVPPDRVQETVQASRDAVEDASAMAATSNGSPSR